MLLRLWSWDCRGSKAWKITTEDFRVIQVLKFFFILIFKEIVESWNIMLNFEFELLKFKILILGEVGSQSDQITVASWSGNTCQPIYQLIWPEWHFGQRHLGQNNTLDRVTFWPRTLRLPFDAEVAEKFLNVIYYPYL